MIAMQISERGGPDLGIFRLVAVPRVGDALYFSDGILGTRVWVVAEVIWRPDQTELQLLLHVERLSEDRRNAS